jgi:hypothetical protein
MMKPGQDSTNLLLVNLDPSPLIILNFLNPFFFFHVARDSTALAPHEFLSLQEFCLFTIQDFELFTLFGPLTGVLLATFCVFFFFFTN